MRAWIPAVIWTVALAAVGAAADGAMQLTGGSCPVAGTPSSTGEIAGTVTHVLHSKVYVDRRYIGAPPLHVASGSRVCTDEKGEAVFDLVRSGETTTCIILPNTTLQAFSRPSTLSINFETGTSWCSFGRTDRSFGAPSTRVRVRITARTSTTKTIVGVVVNTRGTTVKVWSGSVGAYANGTRTLNSQQQVLINTGRGFGSVATRLTLTPEERIAIARLRVVRP